jgi:signal transduction histidine kinase
MRTLKMIYTSSQTGKTHGWLNPMRMRGSVGLLRAPVVVRSPRGIPLAALRAPLLIKLLGANALVVATLLVGWWISAPRGTGMLLPILLAALVFGVSVVLIVIALRPIRDLESTVSRVWEGDFGARVERSTIADNEVLRVGSMLNLLLDGLSRDRARMQALAADVIESGDRERAALALELHDSTAQRLAALLLNISAAARDARDPELAARLSAIRDSAEEVTNEVRLLAQSVHPRVLDDLGLVAALRKLGRDASSGTGIDVDVVAPAEIASLPRNVSAVLYRVTQEAVRNAVQHAAPRHIHVSIALEPALVRLEVRDDGRGFDAGSNGRQMRGSGLITMRDRLTVLEGTLDVRSAAGGGGTTIVASIPRSPDGKLKEA